ncbi:MAG: hypothetical protein EAZ27_11175 [Cytophagales bacterium]|nr:MAG: hypothetical protein EAZ27_11175 [Cytophagales bacterium]
MNKQNGIQEIFFKFLMQYNFEEQDLDYEVLLKHISNVQTLSDLGNSGTAIFDLSKREIVFFSNNFGKLLGYNPSDYNEMGQNFFADKIHPEDALKCSINGVSVLKIFNQFSSDEKLNHKVIREYRMLNSKNNYVWLVEQYQVLELDAKGQTWLMLIIVDFSPNQDSLNECKSQLMNFKTGKFIGIEIPQKADLKLTKRENEILKLVKNGLLSKEISNKLSISVHTVNTHRQRFLEKLKANNSFEAVMFAAKLGLLD